MIDTSIIRQWNIFIRIFSQKSVVKSIFLRKDADKKIRRIKSLLFRLVYMADSN